MRQITIDKKNVFIRDFHNLNSNDDIKKARLKFPLAKWRDKYVDFYIPFINNDSIMSAVNQMDALLNALHTKYVCTSNGCNHSTWPDNGICDCGGYVDGFIRRD